MSARLDAQASRPFDLAHGPLLRLHLFTRAAGAQIMLLTLHELAAGARSLQILLPELDTQTAGVPAPLAPPLGSTPMTCAGAMRRWPVPRGSASGRIGSVTWPARHSCSACQRLGHGRECGRRPASATPSRVAPP